LFSVTKGTDISVWALSLRDKKTTPFGGIHSSIPPGPVFSPDGRWVAYASAARGKTTVYVQPFPATGKVDQLVARGSDTPKQPRWSRNGKELFFNPSPGLFQAVSVTTEPALSLGNPVAVPRILYLGQPTTRTSYDTTPDGGFVGLVTAGQTSYVRGSDNQIHVVLNWFEELRSRVPSR
jgi:hypothetical protein